MGALCTIGADPEFFIVDGDGMPVSAHKFFPYKDKKKAGIPNTPFRDGFVVEANVTAQTCRESLIYYWQTALGNAQRALPRGFAVKFKSAFEIDLGFLVEAPDDLKMFGCDPSFDAYSGGKPKHPNVDAITHPFRYAGGHMHFGASTEGITKGVYGYEKGQKYPAYAPLADKALHPMAIKLLDLYVGLPMTYVTARRATFMRRKVYGQAGEYRPQQYGVGVAGLEYRTPGAEMWSDPVFISLAYGAARTVLANFHALSAEWDSKQELAIAAAINHGDNIEKLLPTLPGWYTPKLLQELRADKTLGKHPWDRINTQLGWDWWLKHNKLADERPGTAGTPVADVYGP